MLNSEEVIVKRSGKVTNVRGVLIRQEADEFKIRADVQPMKDLTTVRESFGSHISAAIKLYTKEDLFQKSPENGADILIYDGQEWEVADVRKYNTVIPHKRVMAIKVERE